MCDTCDVNFLKDYGQKIMVIAYSIKVKCRINIV